MNLIPGEQRRRHAFVDSMITRMHDTVMGSQAIQAAMGPEIVDSLGVLAADYYVPAMLGRTFTPSRSEAARGSNPVIAVRTREKFGVSPALISFNSCQKQKMHVTLAARNMSESQAQRQMEAWQELFRDKWSRRNSLASMHGNMALLGVLGFSMSVTNQISPPASERVRFRPVMVLHMIEGITTDFFAHEQAHFWQLSSRPLVGIPAGRHGWQRYLLAEESEAYTVGAAVFKATGETSTRWHASQKAILEAPAIIAQILSEEYPDDTDLWAVFKERYFAYSSELKASVELSGPTQDA